MYDNIQILVKGHRFSVAQPKDANFFAQAITIPVTDEIDVKHFLTRRSLSKLVYDFDETDTDQGNEYYRVPATLSFDLDNINTYDGSNTMDHFFKIAEDTTFIKYFVTVKLRSTGRNSFDTVWQGIINQDALKLEKRQSILTVEVLGLEKEFKQYYENTRMKSPLEMVWSETVEFSETGQSVLQEYIQSVMEQVFNNPRIRAINIEPSLQDWRVTQTPFFYVPSLNPYQITNCRTSYERFFENKKTTWDWFLSLCNSMGWVFYFTYTNSGAELNIRNRVSIDVTNRTVDYSQIIEHSISKSSPSITFDNILIIAGAEDGADEPFFNDNVAMKGARILIISNQIEENYNLRHYDYVEVIANQYREGMSIGYSFVKYNGEDDDVYRLRKYIGTSSTPENYIDFEIKKYNTLFINAGSSDPYIMKVNFITRQTTGYSSDVNLPALTEGDMTFSGCAGEMLVRYDFGYPYHYQEYVKDATGGNNVGYFKNNMKKFLNSRDNKVIEWSEERINFNLFEQYNFTNVQNLPGFGNIDISEQFSPVKISIDLLNDQTEYVCQKTLAA